MVTEPYPSRLSAISDNPPLLRISLLGKPALFLGGQLYPFRQPKKAFAILTYLLLHRDRVVSRASLGDLFWPDDDEETARANVRRYLYRVMAALPPTFNGRPWLRTDKLTVRWNSEAPAWLDVAELERASAGESELETAVALYRGDFLEDFHDDWVLAERERLRQLHISNLTRLADARLRVFDYPGAIEALQMLLRSDPWHEDAARRLMTLRVETGDRSGALAEYEALAKRLRAELNTDPMPETMAVYEAIRRNQPLARAAIAADSGKREQQKALPFVGRDRPVAALRRSWERAAIGSGCAVIVSGEAGIGKSRLIHELLVSAESQGARIAFGTVAPIESEPYQAVVEALRGVLPLVAVGNMEPAAAAALATLVPELHERAPALAPVAELPPDRNRQRLFDAVAQAFEQFARARPAILILEDLHWASASTIELVEFLVRRLTAHPILVVASFRDDEPRRHEGFYRLLRAVAPERSTHLSLRGLEPEDLLTLVARIAPDAADHEARARKLYERSDGNPLFVTELLAQAGEEPPHAVPIGISGMVLARVERCSARARGLLENAAVIGDGFALDVLREASAWPFADVLDALDEALDAALVRESAWRRGDFAFSHQLVHAAIYEAIPGDVRKRLHRRAARALETYYAGRAGDFAAAIARQYDAADMYAEAGARYVAAAHRALSVFAQDDAVALASRGLALTSDESARFALLCARETAYARLGAREAQRDDCAALREAASALGDPACKFEAQRRTCALSLQSGDRQAERAAIEELRALAQRSQEPAWSLEALMALARFEVNAGRVAAAHRLLREHEADVQGVGPAVAVEFWFLLAHVETGLGNYADGEGAIAEARAQAAQVGDRALEARAARAALTLAQTRRDVAAMEALATELLRAYRSMGDAEGMAAALQHLAETKGHRFAIEEERKDIQSALELFERIQKPAGVAAMLINRGTRATHLGLLDDAEQDYLSAREIARSVGSRALAALATQNLSCVALLRGNATEAETLALQGFEESRDAGELYVKRAAYEVLGAAQRELGRFEAAIENIEAALAMRGSSQEAGYLEAQSELLPAYVATGRLDDALRVADQVVRALKSNRDGFALPTIALKHAAETYAAAGQKKRASEVLAFAAAVLADRAERLRDAQTREAYLALPAHRRLLKRAQARKAK